jgi:flagellar protein FliO/FliZ
MNASPDMTTAALKMMLSLGLVLAIVWGLYRLAKKKLPMVKGNANGRLIHVVENHCLGVKKHISLVKVPGSFLVIGVGGDQVTLLTQIQDPAVMQSIELAQAPSKQVFDFKAQLRRFTRGTVPKTRLPENNAVVD